MANWKGVSRVWNIIGIDHDTPTNTGLTHSLTIQSQDISGLVEFLTEGDVQRVTEALPAGTYIFTTNDFSTHSSTQAVPAGVSISKPRSEYVPLLYHLRCG